MPNLLASTNSAEVKAKLLMNRLMVKPIPHRKDMPSISIILIPSGKSHIFILIDKYVNNVIPIGLPSNNPSIIPDEIGLVKLSRDCLLYTSPSPRD